MGAGVAPTVAAMTMVRRRPIAPLVWAVLAVLSAVAALSWPAGPLIVGGVQGEPFGIGPLLPGWSLSQELRPEAGPELFVGFEAQPTGNVVGPALVEVRLERGELVLWADRLRLTGQGMREYVATFAVPTDGASYRLAVRVLEAPGGGVLLRGADIGEATARTQLTIMGEPLRGFLALGHRMFQRVPPVRHLEAVVGAIEGWTVAVAAGVAVLGALGGAMTTVLLARLYGRLVAAVTALIGLTALAIWLFVAVIHLSVPLDAGVPIGVLRGLTPTGMAALVAYPILVLVGAGVILITAPRVAVASAASVVRALWQAAVTAVRHWYLAPVPLGGAAAAAVTQDAIDVATALAVLTGAWALLAAAVVPAVSWLRGRRLADEEVLER
ncbi:MAG: hypothetical protein OXG43_09340 [Chloroflexi bacterium]|nr:hypothetical protein [Chloroflexota bacterium]